MTGLIYLVWALICHNPTHVPGKTNCPLTHISATTQDGPGDTGNIPPKPPTPPPPPPPVGS